MNNVEHEVEFEYFGCDDEEDKIDDLIKEMQDRVASITYNEIKKYIRADNICSTENGHFMIQVKLLEQCCEDDDIYISLDNAINGYLTFCYELENDSDLFCDDQEKIELMEENIKSLNKYSNILLKLSKQLKEQADNKNKRLTKIKTELVK